MRYSFSEMGEDCKNYKIWKNGNEMKLGCPHLAIDHCIIFIDIYCNCKLVKYGTNLF